MYVDYLVIDGFLVLTRLKHNARVRDINSDIGELCVLRIPHDLNRIGVAPVHSDCRPVGRLKPSPLDTIVDMYNWVSHFVLAIRHDSGLRQES